MTYKMIGILLVVILVLVADLVYIISMGTHILKMFEKRRKIPTWYRIMDNIARVFSKTPLLKAEERERRQRESFIEASAHETSSKRRYLGLKISLPGTGEMDTYSSLSSHLGQDEAAKHAEEEGGDTRYKPRDIETCQEYYDVLETVLAEIDKYLAGVKFKRISIEQITSGDMKQYHQLSLIRNKLVAVAGMILKAAVKPEVKKYFSSIHYNFQLYINQLVIGLDKLIDFIYQGDKRMLAEGQREIKAANKYLSVINQKMKENQL